MRKKHIFIGVYDENKRYLGVLNSQNTYSPSVKYGLHHLGSGDCLLSTDGETRCLGDKLFYTPQQAIDCLHDSKQLPEFSATAYRYMCPQEVFWIDELNYKGHCFHTSMDDDFCYDCSYREECELSYNGMIPMKFFCETKRVEGYISPEEYSILREIESNTYGYALLNRIFCNLHPWKVIAHWEE